MYKKGKYVKYEDELALIIFVDPREDEEQSYLIELLNPTLDRTDSVQSQIIAFRGDFEDDVEREFQSLKSQFSDRTHWVGEDEIELWEPNVEDIVVLTKSQDNWNSEMDKYVGTIIKISELRIHYGKPYFILDIDPLPTDEKWSWFYEDGHYRPATNEETDKYNISKTSSFPREGKILIRDCNLTALQNFLSLKGLEVERSRRSLDTYIAWNFDRGLRGTYWFGESFSASSKPIHSFEFLSSFFEEVNKYLNVPHEDLKQFLESKNAWGNYCKHINKPLSSLDKINWIFQAFLWNEDRDPYKWSDLNDIWKKDIREKEKQDSITQEAEIISCTDVPSEGVIYPDGQVWTHPSNEVDSRLKEKALASRYGGVTTLSESMKVSKESLLSSLNNIQLTILK